MFLDWVLVITVVTALQGFAPTQEVGRFSTQEACEKKLELIQASMKQSYKGEASFRLVCVFHPQKVRA